jgi:hypothetical protein
VKFWRRRRGLPKAMEEGAMLGMTCVVDGPVPSANNQQQTSQTQTPQTRCKQQLQQQQKKRPQGLMHLAVHAGQSKGKARPYLLLCHSLAWVNPGPRPVTVTKFRCRLSHCTNCTVCSGAFAGIARIHVNVMCFTLHVHLRSGLIIICSCVHW